MQAGLQCDDHESEQRADGSAPDSARSAESAASAEILHGGDVDVVMGDYLAEATMAGVSSMKVFLPMMRPRSTRPCRSLSAV